MVGRLLQRQGDTYRFGSTRLQVLLIINEMISVFVLGKPACYIAVHEYCCFSHCFLSLCIRDTGPTWLPNNFSTWFTLSSRTDSLPCSSSRIKRNPTPAFSARSAWVSFTAFLCAFTYSPSVIILYLFGYKDTWLILFYTL